MGSKKWNRNGGRSSFHTRAPSYPNLHVPKNEQGSQFKASMAQGSKPLSGKCKKLHLQIPS